MKGETDVRLKWVERLEWRFVLIGSLLAVVMTSIPYLLGASLGDDRRVFGGFVYGVEDCYSYVAKMRQGAAGAWLFHIPYTPESHPGALMYAFYLILGKLAVLFLPGDTTTRLVFGYHVARVTLGIGLLLTTYSFLALLTDQVAVRRLAWLAITFGGGLGWLLVTSGQQNWLGSAPLDLILPEGFTFLVLYAFPHLALARILLLLGITAMLAAWDLVPVGCGGHRRWALLAGASWLLMGFIVPFYVGIAWAVTAVTWVAWGLREERFRWLGAPLAVVAGLVSAPAVAYAGWIFTSQPVYAAWASQNQVLSPHPLHYLVAFGLFLVPAALAVTEVWRAGGLSWFALGWVALMPMLAYLPFNLQRRLVEGVQIPLGFLAARGIYALGVSPRTRRGIAGGWILLLPLTNGLLVGGSSLFLLNRPAAIYRHAEEIEVMDWLAARTTVEDVVLAAYGTGNYLPVRVPARVFVGHGPESVRADEKRELVARFFSNSVDHRWRESLIAEYHIRFVFVGPVERVSGGFDPSQAPYLELVHKVGDYAIFEVRM
ncbi:MAG: hypothetical protein GX620_09535 [Chloroflexi bacterium]|nr:hypothetical protein [Chloroflexota bacterium]